MTVDWRPEAAKSPPRWLAARLPLPPSGGRSLLRTSPPGSTRRGLLYAQREQVANYIDPVLCRPSVRLRS